MPRGVGTYALNQATNGPGIRAFPYSTSMVTDPRDYGDTVTAIAPHGVGSIWTAMLWEVYWNFVDQYGFDPNFATGTGGNNRIIRLVNEGLKLQPCSPGFVDGRNAILAADVALHGGANQCLIWRGFAKRGLGSNAIQGSSAANADNIEGFNLPAQCTGSTFALGATAPNLTVCQGTSATRPVYVIPTGGFTSPVTLSASGVPANVTVSFAPNPVTPNPTPPPAISTATFNAGASAPVGTHTLTLTGTSGAQSRTSSFALTVAAPLATAPTLTAPADGATGLSTTPTFTWGAVPGATGYTVEIATDPAFTNVVNTGTVAGTTYTPALALSMETIYYWRVRATNSCGGLTSAIRAFRTDATATVCRTPNLAIPDNNAVGVTDTLTIPSGTAISDLNVVVTATHTYVGDLVFHLQRVGPPATTVTIIDRPGYTGTGFGCVNNHIATTLDDEAAAPVEAQCATSTNPTPPPYAINGTFTPNNPLSAFDTQSLAGSWRLNVSDRLAQDTGTLTGWCLVAGGTSAPTDFSDLANSYGVAWHTGDGTRRLGTWDADTTFLNDSDNSSDDGVAINTTTNWRPGGSSTATLNVVGGAGYAAGWLDWNNDGDFDHPSEKAFGQAVVAGSNTIPFAIPGGAIINQPVEARIRLYASEPTAPDAPLGTETPAGAATTGEVEDYSLLAPLAVQLSLFQADPEAHAITVRWQTAIETDLLGFNLLRGVDSSAPTSTLNATLIPAQGAGMPYAWQDQEVRTGQTYFYWLDAVAADGSTTRYGPVSATYEASSVVTLGTLSGSTPLPNPLWVVGALVAGVGLALVARRQRT